jgi:RNA polymerase sigma-70 factor (ECF subfamily)
MVNVSAHTTEKFMDDLEAIRRLKRGDIGGLEILVSRHQSKAIRVAALIVGDEQIAEDVTQDTFLKIFKHIGRFDVSCPFEPYLMRSVVHAARDAAQKNSKWQSLDVEEGEETIEYLIVHAESVESQVEQKQLEGEMLEALFKLSPRQRAVIVQRYYLGLSEKEMSEEMDVAPGTIKWLLNAARTRLRDLLRLKRSVE